MEQFTSLLEQNSVPGERAENMLVVGTPRPSSSILDEVADNGFFEKLEKNQPLTNDDDGVDDYNAWNNDDPNDDGKRGVRSRSESFHEMFDEKAKLPPIVLAGSQPLLTRQLNIVTNLPSLVPDPSKQWGAPSKDELAEEEALEKEEMGVLDRWRGVGGRGRTDPLASSDRKGPAGRKKSNANSSSALVPSLGNAELHQELLPRYEDRVQVLVLCPPANNSTEAKVEWRIIDLSDAAGRRVRCQVWELHPSAQQEMDDSIIDAYIRGSDAVAVVAGYNGWTNKCISRAISHDRVVVVTPNYGSNAGDAKRNAIKLGVHFDAKGNSWIEIAARYVVLKSARLRGERRSTLLTMEKQLKKTERSNGGSACSIM